MHNHPLHSRVTVQCDCCKIPRDFAFSSSSDHVICKSCHRHQGDSQGKKALRNEDHAGLFRSELLLSHEDRRADEQRFEDKLEEMKERITQRDTIIAAKDLLIGDLEAAIRDGDLNPAVERWLADDEVRTALRRRDSAYRARDYAFAALWQIARIHHPDERDDQHCSCTRPAKRCPELVGIAGELDALRDWETTQVERLHDDRDHGLPDNHPEVLKAGWPARRRSRHA